MAELLCGWTFWTIGKAIWCGVRLPHLRVASALLVLHLNNLNASCRDPGNGLVITAATGTNVWEAGLVTDRNRERPLRQARSVAIPLSPWHPMASLRGACCAVRSRQSLPAHSSLFLLFVQKELERPAWRVAARAW
jgi:hypothetical protein